MWIFIENPLIITSSEVHELLKQSWNCRQREESNTLRLTDKNHLKWKVLMSWWHLADLYCMIRDPDSYSPSLVVLDNVCNCLPQNTWKHKQILYWCSNSSIFWRKTRIYSRRLRQNASSPKYFSYATLPQMMSQNKNEWIRFQTVSHC